MPGAGTENLLKLVDDVERRVEEYRRAAEKLIQDRKELEESLAVVEALPNDLKDISEVDKEEIIANTNRLRTRMATVVCAVHTVRDPFQAEALSKTEEKIAELVAELEAETVGSPEKLRLYVNSCSKDDKEV